MKQTVIKQVEELLKSGWYSNYQMNMIIRSSSADREMRRIRKNPPRGYYIVSRPKKIEGYRACLEYHLRKEA